MTPLQWLIEAGWSASPADTCSLDCGQPGHLKTYRGREIVLCVGHAILLEEGRLAGSYSGAPLPRDSMAIEWPWEAAKPVDVVAAARLA